MSIPTIVLDTNVLESALRSRRGASFALLSKLLAEEYRIALSVALVLEYEDVLLRERTDGRARVEAQDVIDYLCSVGVRQSIFYLWRPFLPDPKDDMILELAIAAGCDAIVTHNRRHFVDAFELGVSVHTPAEFLKVLER
jgi:putative PIN family toxin of toxin-antitoxin system